MPSDKFHPTLFQHIATDSSRNLVVSAGAGAGKTAVLTRRMIKILREQRLPLDSLMVVTFNDKAAVEMKERSMSPLTRKSSVPASQVGSSSGSILKRALESMRNASLAAKKSTARQRSWRRTFARF